MEWCFVFPTRYHSKAENPYAGPFMDLSRSLQTARLTHGYKAILANYNNLDVPCIGSKPLPNALTLKNNKHGFFSRSTQTCLLTRISRLLLRLILKTLKILYSQILTLQTQMQVLAVNLRRQG
jgi:hypothetical protein